MDVQMPERNSEIMKSEIIENKWHVIYISEKLKSEPVSVRRLSKNLVLWRDQKGRALCFDASCPHRGANLGLGKVKDGQLVCKYHGFCFNSNGRCTLMPCEGDSAVIPRSMNLKQHLIRETNGFIFYWHGENEPDENLPCIPGAPESMLNSYADEFCWDIPLSRVIEAMLDMHHLPFAHSPWFPSNKSKLENYDVRISDNLIFSKGELKEEGKKNSGSLSMELNVSFPGFFHMKFGNRMEGLVACTPIDETNTWIAGKFTQSLVTIPFLARIFTFISFKFDQHFIQPDDFLLLHSSEPQHASLESHENHLVRADRAIAEWHRKKQESSILDHLPGQRAGVK